MKGIYTIYCIDTRKFYIGASSNIKKRWGNHKYNLRHGDHKNKDLQSDWNQYGETSFLFSIAEITEDLSKELEWIHKLDTVALGYNKVEDIKEWMKEIRPRERLSREIICIYLKTKEITEFDSARKASEVLLFPLNKIQEVLVGYRSMGKGKTKPALSYKGYQFLYKDSVIGDPLENIRIKASKERMPKPEKVYKKLGVDYVANGSKQIIAIFEDREEYFHSLKHAEKELKIKRETIKKYLESGNLYKAKKIKFIINDNTRI